MQERLLQIGEWLSPKFAACLFVAGSFFEIIGQNRAGLYLADALGFDLALCPGG